MSCALRIEKGLNKEEGIKNTAVNLAMWNITIEYDSSLIKENIISKIEDFGYGVIIEEESRDKEKEARENETRSLKIKLMASVLLSLPLLLAMITSVLKIPIENVVLDDLIVVRPGEKIAVDGIVTEGFTTIDEAMFTGETLPVDKKSGDTVFGGTINKNDTLTFRSTKVGKDTVLARIIKAIEDAQGSKAPIQQLADRVAGVFVPIVLIIALISFSIWYFFIGNSTMAFIAAVSVLVIACPCALGLATADIGMAMGTGSDIAIESGHLSTI